MFRSSDDLGLARLFRGSGYATLGRYLVRWPRYAMGAVVLSLSIVLFMTAVHFSRQGENTGAIVAWIISLSLRVAPFAFLMILLGARAGLRADRVGFLKALGPLFLQLAVLMSIVGLQVLTATRTLGARSFGGGYILFFVVEFALCLFTLCLIERALRAAIETSDE